MKRVVETNGSNVTLRSYNASRVKAQTWRFDMKSKTIVSVQYNRSLDIQSNGSSSNLRVTTTSSRWW
jgi:hypothetical protein